VGAIALTLLNFSSEHGHRGSFAIDLYRSQAIRTRRVARYHDKVGPSVLCAALFAAVALNYALEGKTRGLW
jgi:hypothetical protein